MMKHEQRSYLAQYFSDIADWHGVSNRNSRTAAVDDSNSPADAYASLAEHIRTLDEDDLRLSVLARLTRLEDPVGFAPGPHLSAAIAELGRLGDGNPSRSLDHLVHAALNDQPESDYRLEFLPGVEPESTTLRTVG